MMIGLWFLAAATQSMTVANLKAQVDQYGDLCAESSSGYENMSPSDAHYEGVKCAVESVLMSLENNP